MENFAPEQMLVGVDEIEEKIVVDGRHRIRKVTGQWGAHGLRMTAWIAEGVRVLFQVSLTPY